MTAAGLKSAWAIEEALRGLDRGTVAVRHYGVLDVIDRASPNFDERQLPVSMIVLHYTGMPDCEGALCRLTSPEAKVSAHYCVDEDGTIYRLVNESKRACSERPESG